MVKAFLLLLHSLYKTHLISFQLHSQEDEYSEWYNAKWATYLCVFKHQATASLLSSTLKNEYCENSFRKWNTTTVHPPTTPSPHLYLKNTFKCSILLCIHHLVILNLTISFLTWVNEEVNNASSTHLKCICHIFIIYVIPWMVAFSK